MPFLLFSATLIRPLAGSRIVGEIRSVLFVALFVVGFLIYRQLMRKKVVISVAAGGLTVDQRPGDVFSFRDAELGQWRAGKGARVGRAFVLGAGPQCFVLGEAGSPASGIPVNGPQLDVQDLEAWIKPRSLDELLAVVDHQTESGQTITSAAPGTRRPYNWWVLLVGVLTLLFIAGAGLHELRRTWYPAYQYGVGTPTTAIIVGCDKSSAKFHLISCTGTWTVNGQTQSGLIDNGFDRNLAAGSSLAVHVKDGTAYTAHSVRTAIFLVALFGLLLIGLCALLIRGVWSIRRAR
ncbi:hypothetical protein A5706_24085 [Mycobacterium sp. E796]|nr:hypothetical protein A5706_24085 [Mycobacterium sp. E796]